MKYQIVLDQRASQIIPSETGMSFKQAIQEILEYTQEAGYSLQEAYFNCLKKAGEGALESFPIHLE